jgi:phosphatidylinositol alpha-1,6-mannosyltransferase
MKKTNTLIITRNFYPVEGGIETYMLQLAKNWDRGQPAVMCYRDNNEPIGDELPFKVFRYSTQPLSYMKGLKKIFKLVCESKKSFLLLKLLIILILNRNAVRQVTRFLDGAHQLFHNSKEDWIIQCSKPITMGVVGLIIKVRYGYPYITYIHGAELLLQGKKWNIKKLFNLVMKHADLVIANSNYIKSLAISLGVKREIKVVNLGANTNLFYPIPKNIDILHKHNVPTDAKILLTVSSLIPNKGNESVIQIMPNVLTKYNNTYYLIVGEGKYKKHLRQLAIKLGVIDNVRFCGEVPHNLVNEYINTCDIFIMPNRYEGFGIVFLEANACKKPVIGGNSGGVPEAIVNGETGYLVDPDNMKDIEEKTLLLLDNPNMCKTMGEAGFKRVIERYNWEAVCARIGEIIRVNIG